MRQRRILPLALLTCALLLLGLAPAFSAPLTDALAISRLFQQISLSPTLANPAMVLIDRKSGEIVFEKNAASLRRPASILKIVGTAVALNYLEPAHTFVTRTYLGKTPRTIVLEGSYDPWMTVSSVNAKKYHRAWVNELANKTLAALDMAEGFRVRSVVVKYSKMYASNLSSFAQDFRAHGVTPKFVEVTQEQLVNDAGSEIASVVSPSVAEMTKFALTWSDNLLAERLARAGAHAAGFSMSDAGVREASMKLLAALEIDSKGLYIHDGSGLSKEDRVTATIMAQVLVKIRLDEKFAAIYEGLPVSGLTGTLEDRYFATAPEAIGLVHAKTGTLDGTVSLAGYVDAGDREYIFVGIADHIRKGVNATTQARNTFDRLLGKIASPFIVRR